MATYNYKCKKCENEFENSSSIAKRLIPTESPCEKCGGEIYQKIGTINFCYSGSGKHSNDFNDKLKDMRKNLPKGKLPIDDVIH